MKIINSSKMIKQNFFRRLLLTPIIFLGKFFLIYTAISIFLILFFRIIDPPTSAFINSNIENPLLTLISFDDIKQKPVSLNNISRYIILSVVASEDQRFFEHFGFDFEQIEKAMHENTRRRRIRGASTITMQVAKNLFLWSGKNIIRKGFEAYYTVLLELFWSKARIIEVYLNLAEMGKNIYGVHQSAKIYYKKTPSKLSILESATLASILPNPKKRNPARPSSYVISRRDRIITQMNQMGGVAYLKKYLD